MLTLKNTHTAIHDGPQQPRRPPRDAGTLLRHISPQHYARRLPADGDTPSNADLPHPDGIYGPISMRADLYPGETPARWARSLGRWCAERGFDLAAQTSVNLFRCPWEFDLMTEAYQLRRSLGRALQFRADVRRFAALTAYRLGQRFALALDPRPPAPRRVRGGAPARQRRRREGRLAGRRAVQLRRQDGRAPRVGRRREPVRHLRHDGQRGDLAR